jgi:hypothetical protein
MGYPCTGFIAGTKEALGLDDLSTIVVEEDLADYATTGTAQEIVGTKTYAVNALLLKSSTAESTKVFKITVVDDGTLDAVEVVEE